MPNFLNRVAFKCSQKEWESSRIQEVGIDALLLIKGFDLSKLQFYPNKPYVVTHYMSRSEMIGTTNTPYKEFRTVFQEWNAEMFYALCCQFDQPGISVGEYFTDAGQVYQCTKLKSDLIYGKRPGKKDIAFVLKTVTKSTLNEISASFGHPVYVEEVVVGKSPQKFKRGRTVLDAVEEAASAADTIEKAETILESDNGMSLEEMKTVADIEPLPDTIINAEDNIYSVMSIAVKEAIGDKEAISDNLPKWFMGEEKRETLIEAEPEVQAEDIQTDKPDILIESTIEEKWLDEEIGDEVPETRMIHIREIKPLNLKEVVEIFASCEHPELCWGGAYDNLINGEMVDLESIHKGYVMVSGESGSDIRVEFADEALFRNREHFLLYALQICKEKGWK